MVVDFMILLQGIGRVELPLVCHFIVISYLITVFHY